MRQKSNAPPKFDLVLPRENTTFPKTPLSSFTNRLLLPDRGLDHQRRPLARGELLGGGRGRLRRRRPRRTGTLVPVQDDRDAPLVVHDLPGGRLIVQLQGVDRLAHDFRYRRDSYWHTEGEGRGSRVGRAQRRGGRSGDARKLRYFCCLVFVL